MPQAVKISTNVISGSINKNGVSFNIEGAGRNFGSLDGGNWYSNVLPDDGRWVIISESKGSGIPAFWLTAGSADSDLLTTVNGLPARYNQTDFTDTGSAFDWIATQDYMVLRSVPDQSDADGLAYKIDANNLSSYPRTGTKVGDLSGYVNDGTLTNGVVWGSTGYFTFDGVDDVVVIPYNASMQPTTALTMEAWIWLNGLPSSWYSVFQSPETNGAHTANYFDWAIYINYTGGLHTRINGISDGFSTGTTTKVQDRTWSHAVITWNGSLVSYYLQGKLIQTKSLSTVIAYNNNTDKLIGANAGGFESFKGNISDVKLYNRALSADDVKQNYFGGPIVTDGLVFNIDASNLVSYENGSTTTYSLTGSLNGTLTNGVGYLPGNGGTFDFDGTNDYILVSNGYSTVMQGNDYWTVSVWVNADSFGSSPVLISPGSGQLAYFDLFLELNSSNIWMAAGGGSTQNYIQATPSLSTNTWYHVTWVKDGATTGYIYLDGKQLNTSVIGTGLGSMPNTAANFSLGSFKQSGGYYLNGKMPSILMYDRALTAEEIGQNYNAQKQKFQK